MTYSFRLKTSAYLILLLIMSARSFGFRKDSSRVKKGNTTWLAVPTLGSAPETGFYFGSVALADFKFAKDSLARHSVVKTELTYSLKNQFIAAADWTLSQKEGRWIFFGKNAWLRFPELFWGFGGKAKRGDDFLYDARRIELSNSFYKRISTRSAWYLGLCQQYQHIYQTAYLGDMPIEKQALVNPFSSIRTGISSGLGLGILKDNRSNLLNPKAGEMYLSLQGMGFGKALGSDFGFAAADADLRYFRKAPWGGVTAFQLISRHRTGGSPFRMQGILGGNMMLRGYYFGRYRDLNFSAAQAEYRYLPGRLLGFTAFAAAGQVYRFDQLQEAGKIKWSGGLGIRIRVDKKENTYLRSDFAMTGEGDFGFYFAFGEAF